MCTWSSSIADIFYWLRVEQALAQTPSATATLASPIPNSEQDSGDGPRSGSSPSKAASALAAAAGESSSKAAGAAATPATNGKDSGPSSPSKRQQRQPHQGHQARKSGFFDSLWQLDISYERGKAKE